MLNTNLPHLESLDEYNKLIDEKGKFVVACGRMGPMCIPVYDAMDNLSSKYSDVKFMDMDFDTPTAMKTIRSLPEVRSFNGLPFTVYFNEGKVVAATTSIQTKAQIKEILNSKLA
ncbi:MAG: thioredoxin family protein [Deltaproteobacteria bacterium]|nr:thioredoxin family protein [Deltaproteobacteria bacterium]